MNFYIAFAIFIATAGRITTEDVPQCGTGNCQGEKGLVDINKIADAIINQVQTILVRDGYDPLSLPPYEVSILHLGLIGKLKLDDCQLYSLSTVFRSKDIESEKINKTVHINAAVGFDKLKINCTYKVSLLTILNKKGKAVVTVPSLSADTDLDFDLTTVKVHLNDLQLHNDGLIDVHLEGGLLDGILSVLTEAISNLFQFTIINYVEKVMEDELRKILEGSSAYVETSGERITLSLLQN